MIYGSIDNERKKNVLLRFVESWYGLSRLNQTNRFFFSFFFLQANPPQFDKAEELSQLRFLNESSVLHTLRQRYASNLIHTYAGDSMIIINPVAPLAIYSEKASDIYRFFGTFHFQN